VQAFVIFVLMTAGFINACGPGKVYSEEASDRAVKILDCQLGCYSRLKCGGGESANCAAIDGKKWTCLGKCEHNNGWSSRLVRQAYYDERKKRYGTSHPDHI